MERKTCGLRGCSADSEMGDRVLLGSTGDCSGRSGGGGGGTGCFGGCTGGAARAARAANSEPSSEMRPTLRSSAAYCCWTSPTERRSARSSWTTLSHSSTSTDTSLQSAAGATGGGARPWPMALLLLPLPILAKACTQSRARSRFECSVSKHGVTAVKGPRSEEALALGERPRLRGVSIDAWSEWLEPSR